MSRNRGLPVGYKICIAIGMIAMVTAFLFRGYWFSTAAQNQIDTFLSSPEQEIQIIKLFSWPWEYVCSTGDYADMRTFENAIGRPATLREQLLWFWYGVNFEKTDNLIFEDSTGRVFSIYQYHYFGELTFHKYPGATGSRCIKRAENVYVKKSQSPGNFRVADSLEVLSKQGR